MIRIDMKMPRCCSECPFEDDERWQCNALFGTDESLVKYRQTFQIGRTKRLDICPLKEEETVTEFADRCKECGARYGKLLKQGYEAEIITHGNCMMCGKELTEGLFLCKECEAKIEKEEK